jgi:hypothetical protein
MFAADQNPQDPQFSSQDHMFGALLRLIFLRVAEELSPEELEHFFSLELSDPRAFQLLHQHNEARYSRLVQKHRNGGQAAPAAPASNAVPTMPNGRPDSSLQMTRAVSALFNQALSKKGGR